MNKIFQELKDQMVLDYHTRPGTLLLEFIGTVCSVTGATSVAFLGHNANFYYVLSFYLVGSFTWTIAAKLRNNSFNLILSFCFTLINIIGLSKLFLGL